MSSVSARGWKAYRVDGTEDEPPKLAFYCPDCAREELVGEGDPPYVA